MPNCLSFATTGVKYVVELCDPVNRFTLGSRQCFTKTSLRHIFWQSNVIYKCWAVIKNKKDEFNCFLSSTCVWAAVNNCSTY